MEREYVSHRASSARRPVRSSPYRKRNVRRKSGPPPILFLGIILIAIIILVVILVVKLGGGKEPGESSPASSLPSPVSNSALNSSSQLSSSEPASQLPATPPPERDVNGLATEQIDSILRVGNSGYEYYNFDEEIAKKYITAITGAGESLAGSATVYNMVIPTSMDIVLPEKFLKGINTSDQKKAIEYIYGSIGAINPSVKTVPVFDALKLHNNEDLYFRTDHHWTQLGAYYAYAEFCKAKGVEAVALDQFDRKDYGDYLGTFYAKDSALGDEPDQLIAYVPRANVALTITEQDGNVLEDWPLIADGGTYGTDMKYLIYIGGDQPYEEIENKDLNDGSACLVVKESFGNAFVPFLVNHYQYVYVVDYRYYEGNISSLCQEKKVNDVLFLNNISMTRNEELVDTISEKF